MRRLWIALILSALFAPVAFAHPTATTFVVIRVSERTIDLQVTANGRALALTLAGLSRGAVQPLAPTDLARDAVAAHATDLVRLSELTADGIPVGLRWAGVEDTPDAARDGLVTVRLTGTLPDQAATLRWRAPFLLTAYPLAVVNGGANAAPETYEWLAGSQESRVYRLDAIDGNESA